MDSKLRQAFFSLSLALLLLGSASAASNIIGVNENVTITVIGIAPGGQIPIQVQNPLGVYNTNIYPITNWSTVITIPINTAEMNTYHGQVPFQFEGNGTSVLEQAGEYTINEIAGSGYNGMIMSNTIAYHLPFYIYLTQSQLNPWEQTALEATGISSSSTLTVASLSDTVNSVAYGTTVPGAVGTTSASVSYNALNGNLNFVNTSITTNPSPTCIQVTSPDTESFCVNATHPQPIPVVTCGSVMCVSNKPYYWLNFTFASNLHAGNKATYNYTVHDITNGTNLVPFTTTGSQSSLSVSESFKIPAIQQVEITEGTAPTTSNYTKQYIDPVSYPTACSAYFSINGVNAQATSSNTNFQLLLNNFPYNGEIGNVLIFNGVSGATFNSWVESNSVIWANLGATTIPATGSTNGIVYGCLGSATSNFFLGDGNNIGEAPQLTGTYAQYDNGWQVFNSFYDNFGGTSLYSGRYQAISGYAEGGITVSNGFSMTYVSGSQSTLQTAATFSQIFEEYGSITNSGNGIAVFGVTQPGVAGGGYGFYYSTPTEWQGLFNYELGAHAADTTYSSGTEAVISNWLYGGDYWSEINYADLLSISTGGSQSYPQSPGWWCGNAACGGVSAQWLRVREIPPANVMPSVTYGPLQFTYTAPTITQPTFSNTIVDVGQYDTASATISFGTANYVGNIITKNAGTITNTVAVASQASTSIAQTFYIASNQLNSFTANFVGKDSNPTSFNSVPSASVSVYTALGTPTISTISNTLIDSGQSSTFTPSCSGGATPYDENIIISNTVTKKAVNSINVVTSSCSANTIYFGSILAGNTLQANVVIYDSATTNEIANSIYYYLGYNSVLTAAQPTPTNTLDLGQLVNLQSAPSGGTQSYSYNWFANTGSAPGCTTANSVSVTTANYLAAPLVTTYYAYNVIDSATTKTAACSSGTEEIVDPALGVSISAPSNAIVDAGQYQSYTATITPGTPNYYLTLNAVNSISIGTVTNGIYYSSISATSKLWTYYIKASDVSNSPIEANAVATDSATVPETVNSPYSATYKVYTALGTVTISPISNTLIDYGQFSTFSAQVGTGAPSYVQNIIISNTVTKVPINSISVIVGSSTSETIYFPSWYAGNTLQANVVYTDSATTNEISASVYYPLGFNALQTTGLLTETNTMFTYPGYSRLAGTSSGGTGTLTINWFAGAACSGGSIGSGPNILVQPSSTTTYSFNSVDSASTPTSVCSTSNTVTVNGGLSESGPSLTSTGFVGNIIYGSQPTLTVTSTNGVSDVVQLYMTLAGQAQGSPLVSGTSPQSYTLCSGSNFCPGVGQYTFNAYDTDPASNVFSTYVYVPVNFINASTIIPFTNNAPTTNSCVNNAANGICTGTLTYASSTNLNGNIMVWGTVIVNSGQTLTTNGFIIAATNAIINLGTIKGGYTSANVNYPNSYAGSGGGGGAQSGGNPGSAGSNTVVPTWTNANIVTYSANFSRYFVGAAGGISGYATQTAQAGFNTIATGGSGGGGSGGAGCAVLPLEGYGSYPVELESPYVIPGTITASGQAGVAGGSSTHCGGGGGGGGSLVLIAYNSFLGSTASVSAAGGAGGAASSGTTPGGAGGAGGNGFIELYNYLSPPLAWYIGTYYPYQFTTTSPSSSVLYTANQIYNGVLTNLQQYATNVAVLPSPSQSSGIYSYNFTETNTVSRASVNVYANVSVNMTDIKAALTYNIPVVQYLPNFVNTPSFSVTPTSWYLASDFPGNQHSNTITGDQWSNANQIFSPQLVLTYNGFSPFTANLLNNPSLAASLTQNAFILYTANVMPNNNIYTRELFNSTSFDMQFFFNWGSQKGDSEQLLINNYTLLPSNVYSTAVYPANDIQTWIANSLYQNPNVIVQNYTTVVTASGYSGQTTNFYCPFTLSGSQYANAFSYLPNFNSTSITMSVYLANGQPATNYVLVVQSFSPAEQILSQQLTSPTSFTLTLQQNTLYRFLLYNTLCQLVYTGAYTKPTSPVTLQLPSSAISVPYLSGNLSAITHSCVNTQEPNNVMQTECTFANNAIPANALYMQLQTISAPYGTVICANTIVAASGNLYCWSPNIQDTKYSWGLLTNFNDGAGWLSLQIGSFGDPSNSFGNDAPLLAMLACIILALLFIRYNIAISVILVGIGVEAFGVIGLINYGTIQAGSIGGGGLIIFLGVGLGILTRNTQ